MPVVIRPQKITLKEMRAAGVRGLLINCSDYRWRDDIRLSDLDLRTQRRKLAFDLKTRSGYDFSLPIGQIEEEIAVIEAGIEKLDAHKTSGN